MYILNVFELLRTRMTLTIFLLVTRTNDCSNCICFFLTNLLLENVCAGQSHFM